MRPIVEQFRSWVPNAKAICFFAALLLVGTSPLFPANKEHPEKTLSNFSLVDGAGKEIPLSTYKGRVILIVNVASGSMFSGQIAALSKLQDQYKDKGLTVIAIPSNDFGKQEPAADADIQKHYRDDLHVSFLVTARSAVSGKDELPVFDFLTGGKDGKPGDEVHWSFTKFIVGREGKVLARFAPDVAPDDPDFQIAIEKALDGTLKPLKPMEPKKSGPKPAGGRDDDDDG